MSAADAQDPSEGLVDEDELTLDEVREYLYVALRAQERFTTNLKVLVEDLDKRKDDEEWLEQVQDEVDKGRGFYQSQLAAWDVFGAKMDAYVALVRREADELAIEELQVEKKAKQEGEGSGRTKARRATTVHPELTKFKLEKQARILGKYGGVPAMGGGLVMGRLPRDIILKATASPAAVEIQYSKVEGKDAQHLARVMQFKAKQSAGGTDGSASGSKAKGEIEPTAAWQTEMIEKKGKHFFKEHEAPAAASTTVHAAYGGELAERLKAQQAALAAHEAAAATPKPKDGSQPSIGSATGELADKLKRQQATLKAAEKAAALEAARAAAEAEEAAHPTTPSTNWANPAMPFGSELSAALKERQQRQQSGGGGAAGAGGTPGPATSPAPEPSPGFSFRSASSAIATAGSSGSFTPPAGTAPRRPPPGAMPLTPPGAGGNELAELLRKRREAAAAAGGDGA